MPLKYITDEDGQFICPNCGVKKRIQSTMHYHIRNCLGNRDNVCTICNASFYSKNGLDVHLQLRHQGQLASAPSTPAIKTYECPFKGCTFKKSTKGNCRIHCMRVHFNSLSSKYVTRIDHEYYGCTLCTANFTSLTHYYYHIGACLEKNEEDELLKLPDEEFAAFMTFSDSASASS